MNIENAIDVEFKKISSNEIKKLLEEERELKNPSNNTFYNDKNPFTKIHTPYLNFEDIIFIGTCIGLYLFF